MSLKCMLYTISQSNVTPISRPHTLERQFHWYSFNTQNESPKEIFKEFRSAPAMETEKGFYRVLVKTRSTIFKKLKNSLAKVKRGKDGLPLS